MADVVVTGGAGFMGRWVVKQLLKDGHNVWIIDNLSNGCEGNIREFKGRIRDFIEADIKDRDALAGIFRRGFQLCLHLAAAINVQDSIDNPLRCFEDNVKGTFNVLEECKKRNTKIVFMSSALIYHSCRQGYGIKEDGPLNSSCPYAACKIAGENLTLSYHRTYQLPAVILRPFSIYGPYQRSDSEGGVMSIFIERNIRNKPIEVFGDGNQGRDFFYIEDCAEFIVRAAFSDKANGMVFNAGSGSEIKIKDLAAMISDGKTEIKFVKHPHLHAEIMSMRADSGKVEKLLGWKAKTGLREGIEKTRSWLESR